MLRSWMSSVLLLLAVAACSETSHKAASGSPGGHGETGKPGTYLAYEQQFSIRFDEDLIGAHVDALRAACAAEKEGKCSLLNVRQSAGNFPSAEITMRVAPATVESLVKIASDKGSVWMQTAHADDLAEAVANTDHQRALLDQQRLKFEALQVRKDIAFADQMQLAKELSALEVARDTNEKESALERRRIETNLVTFSFTVESDVHHSEVARAFRGLRNSFDEGLAQALTLLGYGLPFLFLAFPFALAWRWLWRRVTRKSA